jgi:hypothetical protein
MDVHKKQKKLEKNQPSATNLTRLITFTMKTIRPVYTGNAEILVSYLVG